MPRIEHVFACMITNPETGIEGIAWHVDPTHPDRSGPLLTLDGERVESMCDLAQLMSNASGLDVTVAKFSVRLDGRTFHPQHKKETPGNG